MFLSPMLPPPTADGNGSSFVTLVPLYVLLFCVVLGAGWERGEFGLQYGKVN